MNYAISDLISNLSEEAKKEEDVIIDALKKFRLADSKPEEVFNILANSIRERKNVSKRFSYYFMLCFNFNGIDIVDALRIFSYHVFLQVFF